MAPIHRVERLLTADITRRGRPLKTWEERDKERHDRRWSDLTSWFMIR